MVVNVFRYFATCAAGIPVGLGLGAIWPEHFHFVDPGPWLVALMFCGTATVVEIRAINRHHRELRRRSITRIFDRQYKTLKPVRRECDADNQG